MSSPFQPFIDIYKLFKKQENMKRSEKSPFIAGHFMFAVTALVATGLRLDIHLIVMLLVISWIFLILFGLSSKNVFTRLSARRGLFVMMACVPTLMLFAGGIYVLTQGFSVQYVMYYPINILRQMPFIFIAMAFVIHIWQGKDPFDYSGSYAADKIDICGGLMGELGGKSLAIVNVTRWIHVAILYFFIILFLARNLGWAILLAGVVCLTQLVLESVMPKMRYTYMYYAVPIVLFAIAIVNIVFLALRSYM